jgi:DNA polymerase-3 subunit epsilon
MTEFTAIDFETASYGGESACALGLVRVSGTEIVERDYFKIRPPSREFRFTHIHGLTWADVEQEPDFGALWPRMASFFRGVDFIAAHNSRFDAGVLAACCQRYELPFPRTPFLCTVQLARSMWQVRPTRLPDVCRYLAIPLRHHAADSDSEACARIVIAALEDGWRLNHSSTGTSNA